MADTDHELMHRCRCGDSRAFETLVRRWEDRVARVLTGLDGRGTATADIDDLCQEVFVRVYLARHRYRSKNSFSTWLYRIAVNVARDAARRKRRWWRMLGNHRPTNAVDSPPDILNRKETEQQVTEALAALPDKWREPLVMKHYGELTFAEVADVMKLPVSTVKSRVQTALVRLRSECVRRGIDERELQS